MAHFRAVCLHWHGLFCPPRLERGACGDFPPKVQLQQHVFGYARGHFGDDDFSLPLWQASQEVEEEISRGRKYLWQRQGATDGELRYAALDINTGMLFSNVVMYFVILANAATLHQAGHTNITTAAEAAQALAPLAGEGATVLMALGLIGTGLLAVPISQDRRPMPSVKHSAGSAVSTPLRPRPRSFTWSSPPRPLPPR